MSETGSVGPYGRLDDIILELEAALREQGLWEETQPSQQALNSQQAFCFDTLKFSQWLQFVFIVRIKDIIERQAPLPQHSAIVAIAEENFNGADYNCARIIRVLARFDRLIEG